MSNLLKGVMTDKGIAKYDFNALAGDLAIPACPVFPIWLCDASTNDYNSPIGQYKSTCSLTSDEFLANFYDCWIQDYDDGYTVSKRILGRDQSNTYDIVEYTFTPKRYSRTVMLSSGMHPPELPAEFGVAYFMKYVMEKTSSDFVWLHNNVRFKVIPLIQPWGFNQDILSYENVNGVNINKNWDVDHVWTSDLAFGGAGSNGDAPYSEAETKVLVNWLNENAYKVDLWIDCHTDSAGIGNGTRLHYVTGCATTEIQTKIKATQTRISQAYAAAGFFEEGATDTQASANKASATSFSAKHLYAYKYCGIPTLMIEQFTGNPLWGGTATINNSEADINNYITNIRAFVLTMLEREATTIPSDNFFWYLYQWFRDNHHSITSPEYSESTTTDTYTITYVTNGYGEQPETLTGVSALPAELPVLIDANDRYLFDGWYSDESLIVSVSANEVILSDMTLYAKWVDTEANIPWYIGGIDTNTGTNNGNSARAMTGYIKVKDNGIIQLTNMSDYAIVDMAVDKADLSYVSLTKKYTLTTSDDGTWTITLTDFANNYSTGKYIRFSIKRTDAANIDLSEFDDTVFTIS